MAIQFSCACGKKINAKDEHAGKKGKCPECGGVIVVPMLATAGVGVVRRPAAAKPRQPVSSSPQVPADDDMYGVKEDKAPRTHDEGIGLGEAITPMPYNPTPRPGMQQPAKVAGAGGSPVPSAASFPGSYGRRATPAQEKGGKLGALGSLLSLSGYAKFFLCAVIVVPIVFFVVRQGPVKAVAQWDKAEVDGENDVRSAMNYIIAKMDEATMKKPEPGEELSGVPYAPQVEGFLFLDTPTIMWRMPDTIEFRGQTSFGPYSGTYWTRKREVIGKMEWKNGDDLQVICKCDDQGNVATLTVDGVNVNDAAAIKKKWGSGGFDFSALEPIGRGVGADDADASAVDADADEDEE